jgi:dTDP-D-glucose 4,6-dehydratase
MEVYMSGVLGLTTINGLYVTNPINNNTILLINWIEFYNQQNGSPSNTYAQGTGKITFNPDVSDGTPRKLLDSSKILSLGWKPSTPLYDGLKSTVDWYLKNYSGPKNAN